MVTYLGRRVMHTRSSWNAAPPKKVRPFKSVSGIVIHFAGFPISPSRSTPTLLRSIQNVHQGKPRNWWDIAYNILVDQNGEVWQGRGLTVTSGANGTTKSNKSHVAICCLIGAGPIPPAMIDGIRNAVDIVRERWPGAVEILPHSAIKPTICPGNPLRTLIANGDLDPGTSTQEVTFDTLRRGMKGTRVARLQTAIRATPDGAFGPRTELAVEELTRAIYPFGGLVSKECGPELWSYVLWTEGLIERPVNLPVFS